MAVCRRQTGSSRRAAVLMAAVSCILFPLGAAWADVIVLANRTGLPLAARFRSLTGPVQALTLPAGDVQPLFLEGPGQIEFNSASGAKQYQLDANSAYFFGRAAGGIDLQKIGLGEDGAASPIRPANGGIVPYKPPVILVKIYVDEEQPALQFAWEARLRRRVDAASEIIERHSRVQLKVVGVGTWNSDNATSDFVTSLAEFAHEVDPGPGARLAIGFTSQFSPVVGRVHMAGTRGPLDSHILLREGSSQINEAERLEFLVHELGHFLGASHSPERNSVMRPVLGDNQAGRAGFQIRFDPVNTLIVAMVGEELSRREVRGFADLSPGVKRRLSAIYGALTEALPDDPAGHHFMRIAEVTANAPLAAGAKRVLQAITMAATQNRALLSSSLAVEGMPARRTGDALTEHLVRQAAASAKTLPQETGPAAFLLGIAVGLDDSNVLQAYDASRAIAQNVETPDERRIRLTMLGDPTLLGRRDVARRFFAAAYLGAALGSDAARKVLLDRETARIAEGGLSFVHIAADRAGVRWGADIGRGRYSMRMLESGFNPAILMPEIEDLPNDVPAAEFAEKYGSADDPRFKRQIFVIDQRIGQMPLYRTPIAPATR